MATAGGYIAISLCNWDHFGGDAIKAYQAGHFAALIQARQASLVKDETLLKEAYYLEAYAQHFLTDIFSTGHMRARRRELHSPGFTWKSYPGDRSFAGKVPILSNISSIGNSVPLFQISPKDPKTLLFRQGVDSRGLDSNRKKVDTKQDDDGW
ncbi:MAG: hypothetical protein Q9164_006434, partial [Protoblastenia rupestris]